MYVHQKMLYNCAVTQHFVSIQLPWEYLIQWIRRILESLFISFSLFCFFYQYNLVNWIRLTSERVEREQTNARVVIDFAVRILDRLWVTTQSLINPLGFIPRVSKFLNIYILLTRSWLWCIVFGLKENGVWLELLFHHDIISFFFVSLSKEFIESSKFMNNWTACCCKTL